MLEQSVMSMETDSSDGIETSVEKIEIVDKETTNCIYSNGCNGELQMHSGGKVAKNESLRPDATADSMFDDGMRTTNDSSKTLQNGNHVEAREQVMFDNGMSTVPNSIKILQNGNHVEAREQVIFEGGETGKDECSQVLTNSISSAMNHIAANQGSDSCSTDSSKTARTFCPADDCTSFSREPVVDDGPALESRVVNVSSFCKSREQLHHDINPPGNGMAVDVMKESCYQNQDDENNLPVVNSSTDSTRSSSHPKVANGSLYSVIGTTMDKKSGDDDTHDVVEVESTNLIESQGKMLEASCSVCALPEGDQLMKESNENRSQSIEVECFSTQTHAFNSIKQLHPTPEIIKIENEKSIATPVPSLSQIEETDHRNEATCKILTGEHSHSSSRQESSPTKSGSVSSSSNGELPLSSQSSTGADLHSQSNPVGAVNRTSYNQAGKLKDSAVVNSSIDNEDLSRRSSDCQYQLENGNEKVISSVTYCEKCQSLSDASMVRSDLKNYTAARASNNVLEGEICKSVSGKIGNTEATVVNRNSNNDADGKSLDCEHKTGGRSLLALISYTRKCESGEDLERDIEVLSKEEATTTSFSVPTDIHHFRQFESPKENHATSKHNGLASHFSSQEPDDTKKNNTDTSQLALQRISVESEERQRLSSDSAGMNGSSAEHSPVNNRSTSLFQDRDARKTVQSSTVIPSSARNSVSSTEGAHNIHGVYSDISNDAYGVNDSSSYSGAIPLSGPISYSGPIPFSGSLSIRSDSSTTSARSFAFPVLSTEWNSSPVKMRKADPRYFRKKQRWRFLCFCAR